VEKRDGGNNNLEKTGAGRGGFLGGAVKGVLGGDRGLVAGSCARVTMMAVGGGGGGGWVGFWLLLVGWGGGGVVGGRNVGKACCG